MIIRQVDTVCLPKTHTHLKITYPPSIHPLVYPPAFAFKYIPTNYSLLSIPHLIRVPHSLQICTICSIKWQFYNFNCLPKRNIINKLNILNFFYFLIHIYKIIIK